MEGQRRREGERERDREEGGDWDEVYLGFEKCTRLDKRLTRRIH